MTDEIFSELLAGIQRSTKLLVDSIGITVAYSELPSWPEYNKWSHKRFGKGWFSRIWCRHFRPWLFPKKHAETDAYFRKAQDTIRAEFLNSVINKGSKT